MSTLLDRLLEVAKDFEAERLQDQLTSQRRERQLEADLKALKRTALYRADEIAFLENQLQDVRSEVEAANEALKEAQDHNLKQSSTIETDMKREIVCLRLEIGRLKNINSKLSEKVDDDEKENSGVLRIGQPKNELSSLDLEIQEEPVLLSRESIDMQDTASSFYMAAENGDVAAMEELLSPACVCIDSYEQLITRALSSVCAAAVNHGEGHVDEEDAAERRLNMAKLLIAEGAATTTTVVKESVSASGSGTNAVKKNKATEEYVSPAPLHMAAWSGDAALVELLLAQPNPPLNVPCVSGTTNLSGGLNVSQEEDPESGSVIISSTTFKGTPLQLAVGTTLGAASTVAKALLMAGADPDQVLAEDAMGDSGGGVTLNADMKSIFDDCTVMFWNSSVRAFEAYSSSNYDKALKIWGEALKYIQQGKLPISGADKARLHYNRARAMCHLRQRVDALEELELALDLSPTYSNARILQAESHFELYSFAKCLNAIQSIPKDVCETNDKIKNMKVKALQQKNMTHYQILGLSGPPSSEADIKKAYRKQSMKWHPDKHQQNKDSKARATTTFKRLNEANQVLSDTYAKMMYDSEIEINMAKNHYGHRSGGGSSSSSSSSSNVYGGYNSGSSRRSSTTEPREGVHRTTYDSTGRSRRASAPPSSQEKDVGSRDSSYYSQSNYADRQQQRRRQEEDPLNEPNVLSDTDEEDDEDDYDDEDEGDLMSNMAAWRKADVLDSMEYDDDELDGGGYSYSAYE